MTREQMINDRDYIMHNVGNLSIEKMIEFYEIYMHGADGYVFGVEHNEHAIGYYSDSINPEYCSCQTDHKVNNQYLRFRPHKAEIKKIIENETVVDFGNIAEIYNLYQCNTKKGYNSGYCFEIAVYNYYSMTTWKQDNKPSTKGGDININGKELQLKYVEKGSLATITSTKKIVRRINKLLAEVA